MKIYQKKKKSKVLSCSVQTESARGEPGSQWRLGVHLQVLYTDTWKKLPSFVLLPSRDVWFFPFHTTLGSLGHQNDTEVLGFGHCGFFFSFLFFALLLENEIFSSFLRNKLVNKFILFCVSLSAKTTCLSDTLQAAFCSAVSAWSCCYWSSLYLAVDLSKFWAPVAFVISFMYFTQVDQQAQLNHQLFSKWAHFVHKILRSSLSSLVCYG